MSEQNQNEPKQQQIEIELSESEAVGTYSNLVMITHSPSEFILDFISMMPAVPKAKVVKRMVITPDHAKRLAKALTDNLKRYEAQFGPIKQADRQPDLNMQFRGPVGQA
jgi:hypothetical protein